MVFVTCSNDLLSFKSLTHTSSKFWAFFDQGDHGGVRQLRQGVREQCLQQGEVPPGGGRRGQGRFRSLNPIFNIQ